MKKKKESSVEVATLSKEERAKIFATMKTTLKKQLGDGIIADQQSLHIESISTGSPLLDSVITGDGYAKGRFIELSGENSCGKSTTATIMLAEAQKAYPDEMVGYIDVEHAINIKYAEKLGLDLSPDKFILVQPNCLDKNSMVLTKKGHIKISDISSGDKVAAVCDDSIVQRSVSAFFDTGKKKAFQLRTTKGTLVCSADHRIKTNNGWKKLSELDTSIDLVETIFSHNNFSNTNNTKLNEDLSFLLGAFIGDGHYGKKCTFTGIDQVLNNKIISIVSKYFPETVIKQSNHKTIVFTKGYKDNRSLCSLHLFLIKYLGRNIKQQKHFPVQIYDSGYSNIKSFIAGLLMTDGTINKYGHFSFTSYIYKNILDFGYILEGFGVPFRIRKQSRGDFEWYTLDTSSKEAYLFVSEVPLVSYKRDRVLSASNICHDSYVKFSKDFWKLFISELNAAGFSEKEYYDMLFPDRTTKHYFNKKRGVSIEYALILNSVLKSEKVSELIYSDVHYLPILDIIDLNKEIEMVDITVPYAHNFIVSNSVVHNSAEEAFTALDAFVSSGLFSAVCFDSVGALVTEDQLTKGFDENTIGSLGRLMGKSISRINIAAASSNTAVIWINQIRTKITLFGSGETVAGGRAFPFFHSTRIKIKRTDIIKVNDKPIGQTVKYEIVKNKVGAPFGVIETAIYFGQGYDEYTEIVELAYSLGIITGGAWCFVDKGTENEMRWNGKNACLSWFRENPEKFQEFKVRVLRQNQGLVVIDQAALDEDGDEITTEGDS